MVSYEDVVSLDFTSQNLSILTNLKDEVEYGKCKRSSEHDRLA